MAENPKKQMHRSHKYKWGQLEDDLKPWFALTMI